MQANTIGIFRGYNIWRLYPLFIATEFQGFRKPWLDSIPKQKRSLNPERKAKTRPSVDRPVNWPSCSVDQPGRPAPTENNLLSVGRPGGRPFLATVDRAVDRDTFVHVVHTSRQPGRPVPPPVDRGSVLACCKHRSYSLWLSVSVLSSSSSLISSLPTERDWERERANRDREGEKDTGVRLEREKREIKVERAYMCLKTENHRLETTPTRTTTTKNHQR